MKKFLTLATMLVMLFSVTLTAEAAKSPSGQTTTKPSTVPVSPKTGESDVALYSLGAATLVFAAGAVVVRRKEMTV